MSRYQWTSEFLSYTPSTTQEASGFPVSRIASLHPHPVERAWRSLNTNQQDVILDMGSSQALAVIALLGLNTATIALATSTNGVDYADLPGSPFTAGLFGDYFRLFVAPGVTARSVRVRLAGPTIDGATYLTLGLAWLSPVLLTFPGNPQTPIPQSLERPYLSNELDTLSIGPFASRQEWQVLVNLADVAQFQQLALLGRDRSFLLFENLGDAAAVYVLRLADDVRFVDHNSYREVHLTVQEQI